MRGGRRPGDRANQVQPVRRPLPCGAAGDGQAPGNAPTCSLGNRYFSTRTTTSISSSPEGGAPTTKCVDMPGNTNTWQ